VKASKLLILVPLLSVAAAASAEEGPSPLGQGFYVAPMASWVKPDGDRELKDGYGGTLAFGYRASPAFALELQALYSALDRDNAGGGSATMSGLNLSALGFVSQKPSGLYLAFGAGYLDTDEQGESGNGYKGISFDAGLGYLFPLSFGRYDFGLRAEARMRHNNGQDSDDAEEADRAGLQDAVFNIGLQLPLGLRKPPPEPVVAAVVPVVAICGDQADNDGDGLVDFPADPGCAAADDANETDPAQCSDGKDNDSDGLVDFPADKGCTGPDDTDEADPCRNPAPGEALSLAGCGTGDVIVLRGVNFEHDRANLTANAKTILEGVVSELTKYPAIHVEISGHTDADGSDAYNQRLSERRAAAVVQYLEQRKIAADRMSSVGYGESKPVASNDTDEGKELNRRVELRVTSGVAGAKAASPVAAPVEAVDEVVLPEAEAPAAESPAEVEPAAPEPAAAAADAPVADQPATLVEPAVTPEPEATPAGQPTSQESSEPAAEQAAVMEDLGF